MDFSQTQALSSIQSALGIDITTHVGFGPFSYTTTYQYAKSLAYQLDNPSEVNLLDADERLDKQIHLVFQNSNYHLLSCYRGFISENCINIKNNIERALEMYKLLPQQRALIDYLRTNAYTASLVNYYGTMQEAAEDYRVSREKCILAPISSPVEGKYALNCDGSWLSTKGDITILPGFDSNNLEVNGLAYYSKNRTPQGTYRRLITYSDGTLSLNKFYDNYFYKDKLKITGGTTFITNNGVLGLTRSFNNPV